MTQRYRDIPFVPCPTHPLYQSGTFYKIDKPTLMPHHHPKFILEFILNVIHFIIWTNV